MYNKYLKIFRKDNIIVIIELPLKSFAWHGLGPAQWDAVNLVRSGRKQQ